MERICVYAGSSPGQRLEYRSATSALGRELAARGHGVVYGGGRVGLMGCLADAVLEGGGQVTGVIPRSLARDGVAHSGLSELLLVDSMHDRKRKMAELASGFIALPGGFGTLEELFEALTWTQLGIHEKPCALLNVCGYFDRMLAFLEHAVAERFVAPEHGSMIIVEQDPSRLLDRLLSQKLPKVPKWLDRDAPP
jgi:uncharacterized protein (TIGR00730 family)